MADQSRLDATHASPNSWENGRGDEEEIEFGIEHGAPQRLFEGLSIEEDRDVDTDGDGSSRASSAHSFGTESDGDGEYDRLRALVRLERTHCRVRCQINGTPGCCGNLRESCPRRGHSAKSEDARGQPGVYEPLAQNRRGHTDARWPPGGIPPLTLGAHQHLLNELRDDREAEIEELIRQEMVGAYAGVGANETEDDSVSTRPTVTFGGVTATPQTSNPRRTDPGHSQNVRHNPSPESFHTAPDREVTPPNEWYGIVKAGKPWKIAESLNEVAKALEDPMLELGPTFASYSAAKTWFLTSLQAAQRGVPTQGPRGSGPTSSRPAPPPAPFPSPLAPPLITTRETTVRESAPAAHYFGFTRESERAIAFTTEQQTYYIKKNWVCSTILTDLDEAKRWLNSGTSTDAPIDLTGTRGSPLGPSAQSSSESQLGVTPSLNYGGPDPSTRNEHELYGVSIANWNALQARMVPEGMSPREALLLIGDAADPCACPERAGNSLSLDAENHLSTLMDTVVDSMNNWTDAQNVQAGRGVQKWSQVSQNKALEEVVKDPGKIGQLILDFDETWPYELESQNLSFKAHLSRHGCSDFYITQWLSTGLLPTLIRQTQTWHRAMLQAVQSDVLQYPDIPWNEGHPTRVVLEGFYKKVSFLRKVAKTKTNFIALVYIHYRDEAKKSYGRDKVMRSMLHNLQHQSVGKGGGTAGSKAGNETATPPRYCTHCGASKTVHPPEACPYTHMSKATVKRLFGNMNATDRNLVLPIFKRLEEKAPTGNHIHHLENAIKEVRGPAGG